ncbi:MAG TPA: exodeoxyribonuclease III [Myxococcales bacterium]|nr:exodeoxyribonuclease III [Myxococcales bacterium]
MKVTTWNVNGIRARVAQVLEWVAKETPDVLCMQEIKASPEHVPAELSALEGYWGYWHGYKGYSGVALHLRKSAFPRKPKFEHPEFDHENRIVTARSHDALIASIYVPNGNKDYPAKVRFLEALAKWATVARATTERMILCGDLNVAREERDVHPSLRKPEQIGQTPAERALLEAVIASGFVDLSRKFRPDDDRLFTWWAPWRNLRQKNIGWRLDYVLASTPLAASATSCEVYREFGTSDHGPVQAIFDLPPSQVLPPEDPEPEPPEPPEPAREPTTPEPPPRGQLPLKL